jgi:signal peptidase I
VQAAATDDRHGITAETRAQALDQVNGKESAVLRFFWEWLRSLSLALVLFFFLHVFVMEAFKIPSGSMEGTLQIGDFLLVNKVVYGAEVPFTGARLPAIHAPRHGEVVVFKWPRDPSKNFVKRLVGLPGDTLAMEEGQLFRNGDRVQESYARHTDPSGDAAGEDFRWQRNHLVPSAQAAVGYHPSRNNWGPIVVPPSHYFVLGDNRDNSLDSRYWGFVPDSLIRGKPFLVYYSYAPDADAAAAWVTRVRWHRLGERIH